MNVNPNTSRHEDKPVRHHLLSTEYDEKISTAGQTADQSPVILHPDSMPGRLETLERDYWNLLSFIGTNQIGILVSGHSRNAYIICA